MKKVYAILEVYNQGSPQPLRVRATSIDTCRRLYGLREVVETFNSREAAEERGHALVRENPTKTYHVVESVQALFSDAPVKSVSFS